MGRPRKMKIGKDCIGQSYRLASPRKNKGAIKTAQLWLEKHRDSIIMKAGSTVASAIIATAFPPVAMMIYGTTFLSPSEKEFVINLIRKAFGI